MDPYPTALTLGGRWLLLVRILWVALVVPTLGLFVVAVPAGYLRLSTPPEAVQASLAQLGLSVSFYAVYLTTLLVIFSLGCFAVAAVIFWRKSDDGMALFVSCMLVLMGAVNAPNADALEELHPALVFPVEFSVLLLLVSLILFLFLFPDGRFVPRWTRALVVVLISGLLLWLFLIGGSLARDFPDAVAAMFFGGAVIGVISQIYRYMQVSNPIQCQQTKWVVFGIIAALVGQLMFVLLASFFPPSLSPPGLQATPYDLASVTGVTLSYFLIPLSIGLAILRYRLWDVDVIINRALVYAVLTTCVVGTYVLVVGGLGALLQSEDDLLISLLATGLIAVLFAPLRSRLQRGVNRLMYGERDDPYAVLSRLGERLEATLTPAAVLPTAVRTVAESLKLPYAAIEVERGDAFNTVAATGEPVKDILRLPLYYGGETVGRLVLGTRAGEDAFASADRRLLDDLTRQIEAAVHAARLTDEAIRLSSDLQRSRERLVTTREEERRRLRRDLHDGLGPQLASLSMKAEAARDLLSVDPARSDALLQDIITQTQEAVTNIRRLVYGLRPPALDDLGLAGALKAQAAHGDHGGLRVRVEAPEDLPLLPAAVEVAAYRIAQEAITNAARHARARNCTVRIAPDGETGVLRLEVADDGRGIPEDRSAGVGLSSMRERAGELGGSCKVEVVSSSGARVVAVLPLAPVAGDGGAIEAESGEV